MKVETKPGAEAGSYLVHPVTILPCFDFDSDHHNVVNPDHYSMSSRGKSKRTVKGCESFR